MTDNFKSNVKKQFAIIAFARYFNLIIEYLVLVLTALLMSPSMRGEFVMYLSVVTFFSLIASLAYDQYGAAFVNKYPKEFSERNYFAIVVLYTILIGVGAGLFVRYWLEAPLQTCLLVALNVVVVNLGKQSVVFFQISNNVSYYFKRFIIYKALYFSAITYALLTQMSVEDILFFILIPNIGFLYTTEILSQKRIPRAVSISKFLNNFSKVKFLYVTAVITACYSFIDIFIIYKNLDSENLSNYNLAMQLNMAVAVIGQAYNVHIYSQRGSQSVSAIYSNMFRINLLIIGLSVFCIGIAHLDVFSVIINLIFGNEYKELATVVRNTIWILPASLVSMFYAPIWISSERYLILMMVSVVGLLLFTLAALALLNKGIQGIIYAQYLTATYTVICNVAFFYMNRYRIKS